MQNYLMTIPNDDLLESGAIHDTANKLKVRVFDKEKLVFGPKRGEIRYFITRGESIVAFETEGYHRHRQVAVLQMVAWYCLYSGMPDATIHANWPLNYLSKKAASKKKAVLS